MDRPQQEIERQLTPAASAAAASAGRVSGTRFSAAFGAAVGVGAGFVVARAGLRATGAAVDYLTAAIQKAAKADGMEKQLDAITGATDRLQLALGRGFVRGLGGLDQTSANVNQAVSQLTPVTDALGESLGKVADNSLRASNGFASLVAKGGGKGGNNIFGDFIKEHGTTIAGDLFAYAGGGFLGATVNVAGQWMKKYGIGADDAASSTKTLASSMTFAADALAKAGNQTRDTTHLFENMATASIDAASATDRLRQAQERLAGKKNLRDARFGLESSLAAFAGLDTSKTVQRTDMVPNPKYRLGSALPQFIEQSTSSQVAVPFMAALNKAGTDFSASGRNSEAWQITSAAIDSINEFVRQKFDQEGAKSGLAALRYGRRELREQLGDIGFSDAGAKAFTRNYIQTPSDLYTRFGDQHREPESVINNYNFGDINVKELDDAPRVAQDARRLEARSQVPRQAGYR